jgi:hypothetical protein
MLERHKEKKAEKERLAAEAEEARQVAVAQQQHQAKLDMWSHQMEELQRLLALASGNGPASLNSLMMKKGEMGIAQVTNVSLVEDRKGPGQWQGSSQGVSFPIGKIGNRSIRYRVGATKGHYVQGAATPTAVDVGTLSITNQRLVYQGAKKTSESTFVKLLGIQRITGGIIISVSNRQKPTTLYFGSGLDEWVESHLTIALALYNDEADTVKAQLQSQIDELQAKKPA